MKVSKTSFNKSSTHPIQSWEWGEFRKAAGNELVRFPFGQITLHKISKTKYSVGAFIKGPKPTKTIINKLKEEDLKELKKIVKNS